MNELFEKFEIHESWEPTLTPLFQDKRWLDTKKRINSLVISKKLIPKSLDIFRAFSIDRKSIKVILVGLEPTKKIVNVGTEKSPTMERVATGIPFSSKHSDLKLWSDETDAIVENLAYNYHIPFLGIEGMAEFDHTLQSWMDQGVFLLNYSLTSMAYSETTGEHIPWWHWFTTEVIKSLSESTTGLIWTFFGKKVEPLIEFVQPKENHNILKEIHPKWTMILIRRRSHSFNLPEENDFRVSKVFTEVNKLLFNIDRTEIDWCGTN